MLESGMHNNVRRTRRIFIHLDGLCETKAARESLKKFQKQYEKRLEVENAWERGFEGRLNASEKHQGGQAKNKRGVFDRLWAKNRRSQGGLKER
jgi:hypothetical protein